MESIFGTNPYFSAGAGMLALTAVGGAAMKSSAHLAYILKRRLLVSLEIPSKDRSYSWFLDWMSKQNKLQPKQPLSLIDKLMTRQLHQLSVETDFTTIGNGTSIANFSLVPGQGKHYFQYNKAWFLVERTRERTMVDLTSGSPWETITITTLSKDRHLFMDMLEEAKIVALSKQIGKTIIYTAFGPEWRPFGTPRRKRPIDSVVLDTGVSESVVKDVRQFLNSSKWYNDRGIPYRRGYLLHGPPGSGKSSFIQSLAGELEYNICIMNLSELGMTDDRFAHLLNNIPPRSIILLEDVDAAFSDRTTNDSIKQGYDSTLTLSGLLNGLDGVVAAEERMVFMTTNHVSRLDPALTRPGRVDSHIYVGNVTEEQAMNLFLRFYENEQDMANEFVKKLKDNHMIGIVSPATLQGHFVLHKDSARAAVDEIKSLHKYNAKKMD
jgi:chaperone BCS1